MHSMSMISNDINIPDTVMQSVNWTMVLEIFSTLFENLVLPLTHWLSSLQTMVLQPMPKRMVTSLYLYAVLSIFNFIVQHAVL